VDLDGKKNDEIKEEIKYNDVELKIADYERPREREELHEIIDYSMKPPSENEMFNVIEQKKEDGDENYCENLNLNDNKHDNKPIDEKNNLDNKETIIIDVDEGKEKVLANQI
jgi:hypothetical protein